MDKDPQVLYCDNHLLVVSKPAGLPVQPDESREPSLLDWAREYIREKFNKPGNVFVGLVHRLDKPVSGAVVLARTSKSAARLFEQFSQRRVGKIYRALAEGQTPAQARLQSWLLREGVNSRVVASGDVPGSQVAELSYRLLELRDGVSHLEVRLGTGRHHQIRVQLAHSGHPLIGDGRYGSKVPFPQVGLHAYSLSLEHPTRREPMTFVADLPPCWL